MLTKAVLAKIEKIKELAGINNANEAHDFLCDIYNLAHSITHDIKKLDQGLSHLKSAMDSASYPACGFRDEEFE